ncbi:MAG: anaerobic C4-dicarboxylate transporter DcuC [Cardiobacteriaceae bacterium]|nr:anaerobic C4-dicarboxylate transporter DcuC [Cardiobacteriaceae bacterium]
MGLIIGFLSILLVGFLIIRGYKAKGVLFVGGVALLLFAVATGKAIGGEKSTGLFFVDISNLIFNLMEKRGGGLGLLIMVLIGFSAYMSHIGANDTVIRILSRPLGYIRSPYILLLGGFFIGSLLSFAISSATALGAFLMATLFPILTNLGISRPSAAAVCATTAMLTLAPTAPDVVLAAENAGIAVKEYAFSYMIPMSVLAILATAIAHFFWQPFCDRKEGLVTQTSREKIEMDLSALKKAPAMYMFLPFLPIVGMLIFDGKLMIAGRTMPKMSLGAVVILTLILSLLIEFCRKPNAKALYEGLEIAYQEMGAAFAGVVILLIAAGVFAEGLSNVGFVDEMIHLVEKSGAAGITMMFALVGVSLLVVVASGSGNAAFYAFVEIAPKMADKLGINPAYLILPMQQATNVGRTLSPVSGVIVAVSGAGNLSPMLLVKRTSVPTIAALLVVVGYTMIFVPLHLT